MKKVALCFVCTLQILCVAEPSLKGVPNEALKKCLDNIQVSLDSIQTKRWNKSVFPVNELFLPKNAKLDFFYFLSDSVDSFAIEYQKIGKNIYNNFDLRYPSIAGRYGIDVSECSNYLSEELKDFNLSSYLKLSSQELIARSEEHRRIRFELEKQFENLYIPDEMKKSLKECLSKRNEAEQNFRKTSPEYHKLMTIAEEWQKFCGDNGTSSESIKLNEWLSISPNDLRDLAAKRCKEANTKAWYLLVKDKEYSYWSKKLGLLNNQSSLLIGKKVVASDPTSLKTLINESIKEIICDSILTERGVF